MEAEVVVRDVEAVQSRSGNTRYVLTADDGKEYTTFRAPIGERALALRGKRARIEFHESERGEYKNVYLDAIDELPERAASGDADEVDEVAWKTAVDAAPWLLGSEPPQGEVPADELFDKLKPFKDLVADDIERGDDDAA